MLQAGEAAYSLRLEKSDMRVLEAADRMNVGLTRPNGLQRMLFNRCSPAAFRNKLL